MIKITLKDQIGKTHIFDLKKEGEKIIATLTDEQGQSKTQEVQANNSVLEIGESFGLDLPYSCRAGACTSCLCGVSKGKEFLDQNTLGEAIIDLQPDEFLNCIGGVKTETVVNDIPVNLLESPEVYEVNMEIKGY